MKWNAVNQNFLAHPVMPVEGRLGLSTQPGLGMDLDSGKIEVLAEM